MSSSPSASRPSLRKEQHSNILVNVFLEADWPSVIEKLDLADVCSSSLRDLPNSRPDRHSLVHLPDDRVANGVCERDSRLDVRLNTNARRRGHIHGAWPQRRSGGSRHCSPLLAKSAAGMLDGAIRREELTVCMWHSCSVRGAERHLDFSQLSHHRTSNQNHSDQSVGGSSSEGTSAGSCAGP